MFYHGVSADPSTTYPLSAEQLQFYNDNGYLVIKKLIGIPALNSYRGVSLSSRIELCARTRQNLRISSIR
ncbi:hypothetical protein HF086_003639 [Spodoptera exigua]|uniref:Uncharacterized protein n=1 Tax=Spodoptera exigua TaxID=7107 RepID=A0A922M292_SPOEX|nr:hypothetical protein HF086_003639 [Spodoptera exigua]